ncbi:MAG: MmcQ/YjbR family DNA-binding protein [Ilumatobacter sp.]|uniref:MmcQ/YjbR family DNA-binding protein n=1 Tax=Ilumatobacter sp. TaxID=1967498 RepID=UPI003299E593
MATWDDVTRIGLDLPEVVVDQSYGTPALKVRRKSFCRMWGDREYARDGVDPTDTEVVVVMCDADEKPLLIDAHRALFETPHYSGYGALLVRLADVDESLLTDLLEDAWRQKAPKTLVDRLDAS